VTEHGDEGVARIMNLSKGIGSVLECVGTQQSLMQAIRATRPGAYLPMLIDWVLNGKINPGKVFDLTLPLHQVAEAYRAMDERCAIKTLLRP
jgi:threonine dehydrogenase-like Zn-dependent dehydrogenase